MTIKDGGFCLVLTNWSTLEFFSFSDQHFLESIVYKFENNVGFLVTIEYLLA